MKPDFNRLNLSQIYTKRFPEATVSTLLIPKVYMERLVKVFGTDSLRPILKILLSRYRGWISLWHYKPSFKVKTLYQEEGLCLQEKKFRPDDADWAELGIIASGLGVSKCWLFSFLLKLELSGVGEFLRIPEVGEAVATQTIRQPEQSSTLEEDGESFTRILSFKT